MKKFKVIYDMEISVYTPPPVLNPVPHWFAILLPSVTCSLGSQFVPLLSRQNPHKFPSPMPGARHFLPAIPPRPVKPNRALTR